MWHKVLVIITDRFVEQYLETILLILAEALFNWPEHELFNCNIQNITILYIGKVQEPNNAKFIEYLPEIRQMMTKITLMKFRYVLQ